MGGSIRYVCLLSVVQDSIFDDDCFMAVGGFSLFLNVSEILMSVSGPSYNYTGLTRNCEYREQFITGITI